MQTTVEYQRFSFEAFFFQEKFNEELKKKATFKSLVRKICRQNGAEANNTVNINEEEIPMMTVQTQAED